MEGNRDDKKGCKVPSLGSDWGVASDRNQTEITSSPGHPGTVVSWDSGTCLTYFSCSPPHYLTSEPMWSSPMCSVGSGRAPSCGQLQAHFISAEIPEGGRGLPQRRLHMRAQEALGLLVPLAHPHLDQSPGRAA